MKELNKMSPIRESLIFDWICTVESSGIRLLGSCRSQPIFQEQTIIRNNKNELAWANPTISNINCQLAS